MCTPSKKGLMGRWKLLALMSLPPLVGSFHQRSTYPKALGSPILESLLFLAFSTMQLRVKGHRINNATATLHTPVFSYLPQPPLGRVLNRAEYLELLPNQPKRESNLLPHPLALFALVLNAHA